MNKSLDYFYQIATIPRPSKKEDKIRIFLVNWAESKSLKYKIDSVGNLIVYVQASSDRISSETVILQSHMDMVCVKEEGYIHDFYNDGLKLYEEDGFLKAHKTTLGADNGFGMAMMMAAVDLDSHPSLELLFTVDEEQGLNGAMGLEGDLLTGRKLINIDTEDLGEVCISSAGGARFEINGKFNLINSQLPQYKILLKGMKGGHSGIEIDKNRGNAIYFWFGLLSKYTGNFDIVSINGGVADNVIPSSCEVVLGIEDYDNFVDFIETYISNYKLNYDCPDLFYIITSLDEKEKIVQNKDEFLGLIESINIGVHSMSEKISGLVNTSMNLGIIKTIGNEVTITYLARSSINEDIDEIINNLKEKFSTFNFQFSISSRYPGWQEDPENELVKITFEEYQKIIPDCKIVAYHAGLECGILVERIGKGCQAVSIGPTILGAHTVNERIEISSIDKVWNILENTLKKI